MEGVIPEDMVHECTKRRQELIGICPLLVSVISSFFTQNKGGSAPGPLP